MVVARITMPVQNMYIELFADDCILRKAIRTPDDTNKMSVPYKIGSKSG